MVTKGLPVWHFSQNQTAAGANLVTHAFHLSSCTHTSKHQAEWRAVCFVCSQCCAALSPLGDGNAQPHETFSVLHTACRRDTHAPTKIFHCSSRAATVLQRRLRLCSSAERVYVMRHACAVCVFRVFYRGQISRSKRVGFCCQYQRPVWPLLFGIIVNRLCFFNEFETTQTRRSHFRM